MKSRAHVLVSGRVQGVFFRARTMNRAVNLGVNGWVMNLSDGRVEAVFEGEDEAVKALVDFCRHGPSGAVVTNVEVKWEPFTGEFKAFGIRHHKDA
jgi:acylphosphatase